MDEAGTSAWCRQNGVYPQELAQWRQSAKEALAEPEEARASPQQTKVDRRRIKELERELRRKDRALAETAALLVLSKKVVAIFNKGVVQQIATPREIYDNPETFMRHTRRVRGCARRARRPASNCARCSAGRPRRGWYGATAGPRPRARRRPMP